MAGPIKEAAEKAQWDAVEEATELLQEERYTEALLNLAVTYNDLGKYDAAQQIHARVRGLPSAGPARIYGIARKGRIAAGYDADLTVVDMKRRETITNRRIASRAGWTPYDGMTVTGWPVGTFVRGRRVMWLGELVTSSQGEAVRFLETMEFAV